MGIRNWFRFVCLIGWSFHSGGVRKSLKKYDLSSDLDSLVSYWRLEKWE